MITECGRCFPRFGDKSRHPVIRLFIAIFVQLFLSWTIAQAQEARLETSEGQGSGVINAYAQFYLEEGSALSLAELTSPERQAQFAVIETREPDFGYIAGTIWLKLPIKNNSINAQNRILMMHTNFMSEISAYLATPRGVESILEQDQNSAFGSRPVPYHELAAPFTINGGEEGALYIRYRSNGDTVLPLSLETPVGFAVKSNNRAVVDFAFYGVMAMMIIASLVGRLFFRNTTFLTYALYVAGVLLLIFQRDGYAFQYLWPGAPQWNDFSSLPLGAMLPVFAAIFTRSYLNTKALHPQIERVLISVCVVNIAVVFLSAIIGAALAKQIALLVVTLSIVVFVSIGVIAFRQYGRRSLFFVIGWTGLLLGSMTMATIHWFGVDITRAQSLDIMRISMVFDALMMGLASIFRIVDMQRDRERLDHERIAVLDANVQLLERFRRLEQKHQLAQSLAETSNQLLVDATHDLRQPLFALRSSISDLASGAKPHSSIKEIEHSFDYIEELVGTTLEQAIDRDESGPDNKADEKEMIEVQQILSSLENMFREDAEKQSVQLIVAPSSLKINARSFAVLRMMANLASNAIRYSPGAKVLIGARRVDGDVSLEVHDTGPGMTEEELHRVKERSARGDAPDDNDGGMGVGLSIVATLAAEHDLAWEITSRKGFGTSAVLRAPGV